MLGGATRPVNQPIGRGPGGLESPPNGRDRSRQAQADCHPRRRCGGLFRADVGKRRARAANAAGPPAAHRQPHRGPWRPHRRDGRRQRAGRVRQFGRGGAMCRGDPGIARDAKRFPSRARAHAVPHRHQPRRRHRRWRRYSRRRRERGVAAGEHRRPGRHLHRFVGLRSDFRQTQPRVRRHRRAIAEKYRETRASVSSGSRGYSTAQGWQFAADGDRIRCRRRGLRRSRPRRALSDAHEQQAGRHATARRPGLANRTICPGN